MNLLNLTSKDNSIILTVNCGNVDLGVRIDPNPLNTLVKNPLGLYVSPPDFTNRLITINAGANVHIPQAAQQRLSDNPVWTISVPTLPPDLSNRTVSIHPGANVNIEGSETQLITDNPSWNISVELGDIVQVPVAIYANSWFDDGDLSFSPPVLPTNPPLRIADTLYNIVNDYTNQYSTYTKVTHHGDALSTPITMTDALVDGFIYRKRGNEYFRLNYQQYSVKLFGAKGDGVTDDRQAILNAIKFFPRDMDSGTTQPTPGGAIYFPRGKYYCSDEIRIGRSVRLLGEANASVAASIIIFEANKNGFIIMRYNSFFWDENGVPIVYSGSRAADGTTLENLGITQRNATNITRGIGVWARSEFTMINCVVTNFKYSGVYIGANAGVAADEGRKVKNIYIANPGTPTFTIAPTVVLTPNHGTVATAILGGRVTGIALTTGGSGYQETATAHIINADPIQEINVLQRGTGARAIAHMGINTLQVTNGGNSYTFANVTINSSAGHTALAHATIHGDGTIDSIIIDDPGSEYTSATVTITGDGTGAEAHALFTDGTVTAIVLDDHGSGYTVATVVITPPNLNVATAHAVIAGGVVTALIVDTPGRDYTQVSHTSIVITGDGTGATGAVVDFKVVAVGMSSLGRNYEDTENLRLVFSGGRRGTGADATGSVTAITAKWVKRISIDNRGTNDYTTPPQITLVPATGQPTDATAWATTFGSDGGNANRWKIMNSRFEHNGYGLYVTGSDANTGYGIGINASTNTLYGIRDDSFLGNTYIACHTETNGWGPYLSTSNTANNVFLNCYSEGNQQPSVGINPAHFIDGTHGAGITGSAEINGSSALKVTRGGSTGSMELIIGGDLSNNELITLNVANMDPGGTVRWKIDQESQDMSLDWFNTINRRNWIWTGTGTGLTFGRSGPAPYSVYNQQLFTGPGTASARQIGSSSSFPPVRISGQQGWAKGDFIFNSNPTVVGVSPTTTSVIGWSRLTTGNADVLGVDWLAVIAYESVDNTGIVPVTTYTANHILVLSDSSSYLRMNIVAANTLTVPPTSSVAFPIGTQMIVSQAGTGQVTVVPGAGVTVNSGGGALKTRVQHSVLTLIKVLSDTWNCSGDITT